MPELDDAACPGLGDGEGGRPQCQAGPGIRPIGGPALYLCLFPSLTAPIALAPVASTASTFAAMAAFALVVLVVPLPTSRNIVARFSAVPMSVIPGVHDLLDIARWYSSSAATAQ